MTETTLTGNQFERIIFNNDGGIWSCGLSNFYTYNLSSSQITYRVYNDGNTTYQNINAIDILSSQNVDDYIIIPSYYTICENNTDIEFSNSMLEEDYTELHTAYCNSTTWQDSFSTPFYEDYSSSKVVFNYEQGFITETLENIILHVEDSNLRDIFDFNFSIPKHKDDSVYYGFMNSYTRNSYNSVTAYFTIYEIFTPLTYDGSFSKYMIYDEDGKYFTFVNGLNVVAYTGNCNSGGNFTYTTTEINVNNTIVNNYINVLNNIESFL